MNDTLTCPTCHAPFDERQLVTTTVTVESCPHCHAMVRQQEGFRWENRDALILDDVTGVETWLDALAQGRLLVVTRRSDEEAQGKYRWEVDGVEGAGGPLRWACSVEYDAHTPHVCEVRLTSDQNAAAVIEDPERLQAVCADHGVQSHGWRTTRVDWQGEHLEGRWGARQFLATSTLCEDLFRSVVNRLDQAMRDVATQFGRGGTW